MGFMDKLRGQLIDIIEFLDDSRDTIVWRFPRQGNEIKMGAQLVVRESQVAIFVDEGNIADVFEPGTHTLSTRNIPILTTLRGWKYGFNSPFKAEVYFVSTRQFTDFTWGTSNPVMRRDAEFGMVRLRAHGRYAVQVVNPVTLLKQLVGTDPMFRTEEVGDFLRGVVVEQVADALGSSPTPVLDMAAQQSELAIELGETVSQKLADYGITVPKFVIENVSVPPEVEQAIDKRSQIGLLGDLDAYTKLQAANALEDAANNPGAAGQGAGMLMGLGLGNVAAGGLAGQPAAAAPAPPPPPPAAAWFLAVDGQQRGPYTPAQLAEQVGSGGLTGETLVWSQGMAQWQPAASVPAVAAVLPPPPPGDAAPPPLPPQG